MSINPSKNFLHTVTAVTNHKYSYGPILFNVILIIKAYLSKFCCDDAAL